MLSTSMCIDVASKNKWGVFPKMSIVFLCIFMGATPGSPDYPSYRFMYEGVITSREPLFQYLIDLCKFLNIPYEVFRLLCIFISLLLVNQTVNKVLPKKYIKFYYIIYFLLPISIFMDSGLLRNFMATSIFIYSFPLLLDNSKKSKIKYIVLILIASMFQVIAIAYLPFVFYNKVENNKFLLFSFKMLLIISAIFVLIKPLFNLIIRKYLISWAIMYFPGLVRYTMAQGRYGVYFMFELQLLIAYFAYIVYKKLDINKFTNGKIKIIKLIYYFTLYLLLFSPLLAVEYTFIRIFRNSLPFIIILFVLLLSSKLIQKRKKIKLALLFMFIYFQYFILDFRVDIFNLSMGEGLMLKEFFTENWILF